LIGVFDVDFCLNRYRRLEDMMKAEGLTDQEVEFEFRSNGRRKMNFDLEK